MLQLWKAFLGAVWDKGRRIRVSVEKSKRRRISLVQGPRTAIVGMSRIMELKVQITIHNEVV